MKYDVLVFNLYTGQVMSVADFCLTDLEARNLACQLNDYRLQPHLAADSFENNTVAVGDFVGVDESRLDRLLKEGPGKLHPANDRFLKTYYRRKADGVCVRCESPNLENTVHCAACAKLNRERSARSSANSL